MIWMTVFIQVQCFDTVGWVIWPVKLLLTAVRRRVHSYVVTTCIEHVQFLVLTTASWVRFQNVYVLSAVCTLKDATRHGRRGRCQVSLVRRPSTEKWTTQKQHGFTYDDGVAVAGCMLQWLDTDFFMLILELVVFLRKRLPEIQPRTLYTMAVLVLWSPTLQWLVAIFAGLNIIPPSSIASV